MMLTSSSSKNSAGTIDFDWQAVQGRQTSKRESKQAVHSLESERDVLRELWPVIWSELEQFFILSYFRGIDSN